MIYDLGMHRILVIGWPVRPAQSWTKNNTYVDVARIYREDITKLEKKQKDLSFHTPRWLQFCGALNPSTWYGEWKQKIKEYDTVILIDEVRGGDVFEYILENNPSCNLCVFYDSPVQVGSAKEPSLYKSLPVRFFTCDRKIAKTYSIPFMPYFYIFSPFNFNDYHSLNSKTIEQDVFFIGEEKGDRKKRIEDIKSVLDKAGLTYDLRLVPQNRHKKSLLGKKNHKQAYMLYSEAIEHVQCSKAVLELISDGQTGITQRPYEALFFKKKLITTSPEVKNYDFYCDENIFVLGERDLKELPQFLNSPFYEIDENITEKYTFASWLKGFLK